MQTSAAATTQTTILPTARTTLAMAAGAFIELITQTLFGGRVYENYGAKIVAGDFEAGFKMKLGLKDLRLAAAAAQQSGKQLPLLEAVRTRMTEAVEAGLGEQDWSGIAAHAFHPQA